jgi:amino acid adenylation domain-containing protein
MKRPGGYYRQEKERSMPTEVFPTTLAQQRLWFLQQLLPDSPVLNLSVAIRLIGPLQVSALEQSLNHIIRRHGALRTTFSVVGEELVQRVHGPAQTTDVALSMVSLQDIPEGAREATARQLATIEARRAFDSTKGPLLRASLLAGGGEDHVLLLTMPQIVADDWSIHILLQELSALYTAFSTGQCSPLPELPMQYADYVQQQRQWLQTDACRAQLAYWRQQLGDHPPPLQLPADQPRPARYTYQGAVQSLLLPADLLAALKALSSQAGVTLSTVLLAAFQTLLYRYSRQEDICVGMPIAARTRQTEGLIGYCTNTLVLRTDLAGHPAFVDLLRRVHAVIVGASAHQDVPFEKLVEQLQAEQDFSRTPLFQARFQFRPASHQAVMFPGLHVAPFAFDRGATPCDVSLELVEHANGLRCGFTYNTDLFAATTIARMAGHFQTLLQGIVAHPAQPISQLPLLTKAERSQLLEDWNTLTPEPTAGALQHEHFEAQVERTPDAIAVVCAGQRLTYRELNHRATQLARYLQTLGVRPDSLVGLCMERSLELVIGLLGTLKAGGVCVPLDPALPQERLAFILEDTQMPVIVTQQRLQQRLPKHHATVVCLDTGWEVVAQQSRDAVVSGVTTGNLSFVFYTSGSTGQPKAVVWSHTRSIPAQQKTSASEQLTAADRHVLKSPIGFTLFSREIFWPLLSGATLFIVPPGQEQDSAALVKFIAQQQISVITLVPSMLRMFMEVPEFAACISLKQVVCFGEPMSAELQERLCASLDVDLSVYYGVTEAPSATSWTRQRGETHRMVNIGRRLPNKQVFVLDDYLQPVPIGVPGEIYIGGRLALGYFNRPELTAEKFIPHPFSTTPGARLYKTGDVARYLSDGNIEYLGRSDQQVKIRGMRVELGEVEAVLGRHPALQEVVVMAWEQASCCPGKPPETDQRLVAYVVPHHQSVLTGNELRRFLKQKLPPYMIPTVFMLLEAIPRNLNGKVDRRALPVPGHILPERNGTVIAPRTPVEKALAEIWAEVLGLEQVSVQDNFFDLGGHSLFATRVLTRVRDIFQVEIPLHTLFELPTLAEFAVAITQSRADNVTHDDMISLMAEVEAGSEEKQQA